MHIITKKLENDPRDYTREFVNYVNSRWKGQDDYEMRQETIALEFAQKHDIHIIVDNEKDEITFEAYKHSNGENK